MKVKGKDNYTNKNVGSKKCLLFIASYNAQLIAFIWPG